MPRKPILLFLCAFWLLFPKSVTAVTLSEDMSSAVIYAYFQIGPTEEFESGLSIDSFQAQADEMAGNGYNVMSLRNVLLAQSSGQPLPPKSVVLTFESFDSGFIKNVLPILTEHHFPFVLLLSAAKLDEAEKNDTAPSWDDVVSLIKNSPVEIGMTPYRYAHGRGQSEEDLFMDINRAKARFREKTGIDPVYFSYPFGEYSSSYVSVIEKAGFAAGLSQTSGVVSSSINRLLLPRFTMTDGFSDLDRFRMTSLALPLPISKVTPDHVFMTDNPPKLQFTVEGGLNDSDLSKMNCFASGLGNLKKEIKGNRVSLVFPSPFEDGKGRVNCTIPVSSSDGDPEATRWRWAGFQFSFGE